MAHRLSRRPSPAPRGSGRGRGPYDLTIAACTAALSRHLTDPATGRPLEPYPEQIAGGRALLGGAVIEMATGEGKTLTAAFAAACWAREGPVHVATANAYLAARDAALLAPVYADLGLRTGVVTPDSSAAERTRAYTRDVVYGTLAEFGFDYLRDRLVTRTADRVQRRGLGALVVDEADLLLIDEARTPLIIARPAEHHTGPDLAALRLVVAALVAGQRQRVAAKLAALAERPPRDFGDGVLAAQVRRGAPRDPAVLAYFGAQPRALKAAERVERELRGAGGWMLDDGLLYSVDERARTAHFTEDGQAIVEAQLGRLFDRPEVSGETLAGLHNLLLAYTLFEHDRDYLVRDGRVVLIEEATGRAAESRRYMQGLHAAIETKELGTPLEEAETLAQISVQQFVRQYARRAGMTGTAMLAATEFARIYEMPVRRIPRHRPNRRVDLPPRLYRTAAEVDEAVVAAIAEAHHLGRPVLAGTADIARSERLGALLTAAGLPHVVLNAREHAPEAAIIAAAGREGAITIATNMAGRGTDIRLQDGLDALLTERAVTEIRCRLASGGSVGGSVAVECASAGGFERLRRALADASDLAVRPDARQGRIEVQKCLAPPSLADPSPKRGGKRTYPPAPSLTGGGAPVGGGTGLGALTCPTSADQAAATNGQAALPLPVREEGWGVRSATDPRGRSLLFALGLEVIAVAPGDNRRLDDQLRGRGGRQGDEGLTRLFGSLEDETIRFYGAPGRRAVALRGLRKRPFLEGGSARRVIDDAQRLAARTHEGQRKVLFEFDQVLEAQRKAMLAAYDRALADPKPVAAVRAFIPEVAAGEAGRRPSDPALQDAWQQDLVTRYGLPEFSTEAWRYGGAGADDMVNASSLTTALQDRWQRASTEAGTRWPELARVALLRAAAELWAGHVEAVGQLQRQAPVLFGFLPTPAAVSFAHEASRRYREYLWAVKAEAVSALLTLPQPYERLGAAGRRTTLSGAARALLVGWAAGPAAVKDAPHRTEKGA